MATQRHFIGLDQPLATTVAEWLINEFASRPLDLSSVAVVVPTTNSGRLLRAALATAADQLQTGLMAPAVITPDRFATLLNSSDAAIASPLECRLTWVRVLLQIDFDSYDRLFPIRPLARSAVWAMGVAKRMVELRRLLGEGGLDIGAVARHPATDREGSRWQQLAQLETSYRNVLSSLNRIDPIDQRIAIAAKPQIADGFERMVLAAVPDPIPLALEAFKKLAETTPIDVLVAANASDRDRFDAWGIPLAGMWSRYLPIPDADERIHLCHDSADQGETTTTLLKKSSGHIRSVAVGVCDPDLFDPLLRSLSAAEMSGYDPGGEPVGKNPITTLLQLLRDWVRDDSIEALAEFLRNPVLAAYCTSSDGNTAISNADALQVFDDFYRTHLPKNLSVAATIAATPSGSQGRSHHAAPILSKIIALKDQLTRGTAFADSLRSVLGEVLSCHPPAIEEAPSLQPTLEGVLAAARELSGPCVCTDLAVPELIDLVLQEIAGLRLPLPHPADAIVFYGWLETLWVPHPHLILAGCNDGKLPATVPADDFLPNSLRVALGLPSDDSRFERDCYIIATLLALRERSGRIDFILGRSTGRGDTLLPSRLLLLENEETLPHRVRQLFREPPVKDNIVASTAAWQFTPPPNWLERLSHPPASVSVTGLRTYLQCPFRYFLSQQMRMRGFDPFKREMDALDFGNVIHAAVEAFNRDPASAELVDEGRIREVLLAQMEDYCSNIYGRRHSLAMQVQFESARERLSHAARMFAAERANGWFPKYVEWSFHKDRPFVINGIAIHGKIDLIEENQNSGQWRLIDFKSSDTESKPEEAHRKKVTAHTSAPQYARFFIDETEYCWTDLQLPLYLLAVQNLTEKDAGDLEVGYFNLPKAVTQTGYSAWTNCADYIKPAEICVGAVLGNIAAKVFWPPAEKVQYDDFAEWLPPDLRTSCAQFEEVCK